MISEFQLDNPRVSVIVPTYNTASIIAETLDSVFCQTYRSYEVIVINDGSPDTTELERVLQPYLPRIHYIKTANAGLSAARNQGLRIARGELVTLLDSDDVWNPDYLEVQVGLLDSHPDADIVYPNAMLFGDGDSVGKSVMEVCPSNGEVTYTSLVLQQCSVLVSVLARREAFERVGCFDSNLRSCEDFDMWLRCLKAGSRIIYTREILYRSRRRKGSLSSDPVWMSQHAIEVLDKMKRTVQLTPEERRITEERIRFFEGKTLFFKGKKAVELQNYREALQYMKAANEYEHSSRLSLIVFILRVAPWFIPWLKKLRNPIGTLGTVFTLFAR